VLIDTYAMNDKRLGLLSGPLGEALYERANVLTPMDRTRLSAFAWLCDLLAEWAPGSVPFPSLLVRASEPLAREHVGMDWQTSMDAVTKTVDATGNHFSMMEDHLESTVQIINEWLTGLQ
jgi:polyene macrolide polyketide synthase